MADETSIPFHEQGDPSGPELPKDQNTPSNTQVFTHQNQTGAGTHGPNLDDPIMQFVVQNFEQINTMYSAFSSKRKEVTPKQLTNNDDRPIIEEWQSDSEDALEDPVRKAKEKDTLTSNPLKNNRVGTTPENQEGSAKHTNTTAFYNKPFVFKEAGRNVRSLVASPFTKRIRDYDMPDGLKVPANLKTYDGLSDPDDHLTVFMGTMDVHKLPEPAWCRFFHITLSGAARFWYDNLPSESIDDFYELRNKFRANFLQQRRFQKTQAEVLGIRQQSDESLKEYLERFGKETLHMIDRSDNMMTGAFISGLRPGKIFKDLIARPPISLEDLYIQVNGFIRAEDANNENRLRESMK